MVTDKKGDLVEASEDNRNLLRYNDKCDKYDYMASVALVLCQDLVQIKMRSSAC